MNRKYVRINKANADIGAFLDSLRDLNILLQRWTKFPPKFTIHKLLLKILISLLKQFQKAIGLFFPLVIKKKSFNVENPPIPASFNVVHF